MKTSEKKRPFYQVHLSVLVAQMLLLSSFLYLQLVPTEVLQPNKYDLFEKAELRGWPEVFIITCIEQDPELEEHFLLPKCRNVILAVVVLVLLFVLQEAWLRCPKPVFTWPRGVLAILAVAALVYGNAVARKEYAMLEYAGVDAYDKFGDEPDYMKVPLYYGDTYTWGNKKWVPVELLPSLREECESNGCVLVVEKHIHNVWARRIPGATTP